MIEASAGRTSRPARDREDKTMTATKNIVTDRDIAYAVGTAADAWGDTDYWVDETGETIGLKRATAHGGQTRKRKTPKPTPSICATPRI